MSFLAGQDRTPKFAGQVLPDRTESGLIFLTFYLTSMGYQFSYDKIPGFKFVIKNLNWDVFENKQKKFKKIFWIFFGFFFLFLKVLKVRRPGRKTSGFHSPDFENLPDFRTGRDVR
jgi:hypothetical protein